MKINEIILESKDIESLKWWEMPDGDYPIRDMTTAIGATHYAHWGKIGVPWAPGDMIGGGGTYILRGKFGYLLSDATIVYKRTKPQLVGLSQISASEPGTGLGKKYIEMLKKYADSLGLPLVVYKVTNQAFFNSFSWWTKKPEHNGGSYVYDPDSSLREDYDWEKQEGYDFENPLPLINDSSIWDDIEDVEADIIEAWEEATGKSYRELYGKRPGGFKEFWTQQGTVENVPINKIVCTEKWLKKDQLDAIMSSKAKSSGALPIVHVVNGQYIASDGNHRIVAAHLSGAKSIKCKVLHSPDGMNEAEKLSLPDLEVGDEVKVGKFKNRKAEITGFDKDEHNQPVMKTTKGDHKVFKNRHSKLDENTMDISTDTKVALLMKLSSVKEKIEQAVGRNLGSDTVRAYKLQDTYNDLKDQAEDTGIWNVFCSKMGLSTKHDARDYWA